MNQTRWRPLPFNQFVLKVHGHCNLSCDYCYIYRSGDQSWRTRPPRMSEELVRKTCHRISEHAEEFSLDSIHVILHGGEPLLVGHDAIEYIAQQLTQHLADSVMVRIGVQTNGLLIDEKFLRIFDRWNIKVGISLDGNRGGHDRHRKYHHGGGSHAHTIAKLALLTRPSTRHLFSGLLSTIDLDSDPVQVYEELVSHDPPAIDFLLPHGNWVNPPPRRVPGSLEAPYADWLLTVFEHWYHAPRRRTGIRLFEDVISLLLGGVARSESVGLTPSRSVVIETDGSLEQVDSVKSAYPGAARLGLTVQENKLSEALSHPAIVARQTGVGALADFCQKCPVHRVCGGGHFAHRYRVGSGFLNPSVYCVDLEKIIKHIHRRLLTDLTGSEPIGPDHS
ncbi:FxsB family cyclophane-forming radical SAM/SPASM peptide maturase [Streptomyces sp. NPDC057617]|uniref:FxsB family cyclophane-forming radical SAM/SPASM peptide maturase n=1 Tax=Streptomyces sp. NPDC057617 TaxID=3346184 RepID=UPI0036CAF911